MRIFITGASGFVGGAAARYFSQKHDVIAMSRSKTSDAITRFAADMMRAEGTINIARAREQLGYKSVISVEDGLGALHTVKT